MATVGQTMGFRVETGAVSVVTFNMPKANIFSTTVLNSFVDSINVIRSTDARALVLRGEGATFMAGADIKEMSGFGASQAVEFARLFHKAMNLVETTPIPVIAGVNGFALGGGCELTLVCDIVVASETAVFGAPEINLGIIPGGGGTQRLAKRVGATRAAELILTGKKISAREALSIGLVNRVVAPDKLDEEVMALAGTIASKPPHAVKEAKRLIRTGSLEKEIEAFAKMFTYPDQKALMQGFLGKK